jgi:hypothetical protein
MMFAYRLSGAYAFAGTLFAYAETLDPSYRQAKERALAIVEQDTPTLAWRWEPGRWGTLPADLAAAAQAGWDRAFPLKTRAFRTAYAWHREIARRRLRPIPDTRPFDAVRRIAKVSASTVEPSSNHPDLFMTSEAIDCLAFCLVPESFPLPKSS